MDFKGLKVAYRPYHKDCNVPGDRRRFIFYAKERNLNFEIADSAKKYDIVYLTYGCNTGEWIKYKKNNPGTKIIFELIDTYLREDITLFTSFRGIIRYITKKESRLYLNYKKAIRDILSVSDAVVCSTPVQKTDIQQYNKNVHISLDYFLNDITHRKLVFESGPKLKLVWEGQAYTVHNLLAMNEVFKELKDEIELHVITDPVIKLPLKIFNKKTSSVLKKLACNFHLHNWNKETFSKIISEADVSIIPIFSNEKLMWNKPENKLLLLWQTGIPVFTSPTPAYTRVMQEAGYDGLCGTTEEWVKKISNYRKKKPEDRKAFMIPAVKYLELNHHKEKILKNWDAIFESVVTA